MWLSLEELLCAAAGAAAEGAEELWAEEAGGSQCLCCIPQSRRRRGGPRCVKLPARTQPQLLMNLGAHQRTGDNPFCFLRDRDEK